MTSPHDTGRFARVTGIDEVASAQDVASIVTQMCTDLADNPRAWENHTLDRFLEALAASLRGLDGLYRNRGQDFPAQPTWKMFAEATVMASGYE